MLTPLFQLSQTNESITVVMDVPLIHLDTLDMAIDDGNVFRFAAQPYFLRLRFPGELAPENDPTSSSAFDSDKGTLTVTLGKAVPGTHFENLHLLATLMATSSEASKNKTPSKPLIEVIASEDFPDAEDAEDVEGEEEGGGNDLEWQQDVERVTAALAASNINTDKSLLSLDDQNGPSLTAPRYGFARRWSGIFGTASASQGGAEEAIELSHPDSIPEAARREARLACELERWNPDHYLADTHDPDDMLQEALAWKLELTPVAAVAPSSPSPSSSSLSSLPPPHTPGTTVSETPMPISTPPPAVGLSAATMSPTKWSAEEAEALHAVNASRHEVIIENEVPVLLGLVDIIAAACYDARTTMGDPTVESGWTIARLSATLSWFDEFSSIDEVAAAFARRSLLYPLYRSWSLVQAVLADTQAVFSSGSTDIIKLLLSTRTAFMSSRSGRDMLNRLYINDYILWVQRVPESRWAGVAASLAALHLQFEHTGLPVPEQDD